MLTAFLPLLLLSQEQKWTYTDYQIEGWKLHVGNELFQPETSAKTYEAMGMLAEQLRWIEATVPAKAVTFLKTVPLYFHQPYADKAQNAAYHPGAPWLKDHGRDQRMARGIEFTNTGIFAAEVKRMPVFALHELAHAFHDQVLGWDNKEVIACYEKAKASGSYDAVTLIASGQKVKHYGMNNVMEYFAESTESYFGKNDFYPSDRTELIRHDPDIARLLRRVWYVQE